MHEKGISFWRENHPTAKRLQAKRESAQQSGDNKVYVALPSDPDGYLSSGVVTSRALLRKDRQIIGDQPVSR